MHPSPTLNRLEVFYHVARHGGIAPAVRHLHGIQLSAVSIQMSRLEESLGVSLFHRRPFALTQAGQILYIAVKPLIEGLYLAVGKIHGRDPKPLRIGADPSLFQLTLLKQVRQFIEEHPKHTLELHAGSTTTLLSGLTNQELDLVISTSSEVPHGTSARQIGCYPLGLLVPTDQQLTADTIWSQRSIDHTLITLPPTEPIAQTFDRGLSLGGVTWPRRMIVDTLGAISPLTADGLGIGLSLYQPRLQVPRGVSLLKASGFDPIEVFGVTPAETSANRHSFSTYL